MTTTFAITFPHEGLSLWIADKKVYTNFCNTIKSEFYAREAQQRLSHKYGWNSDEFNKIDWDALHKSSILLGTPNLIRISKVVTKTLPIGTIIKTRGE